MQGGSPTARTCRKKQLSKRSDSRIDPRIWRRTECFFCSRHKIPRRKSFSHIGEDHAGSLQFVCSVVYWCELHSKWNFNCLPGTECCRQGLKQRPLQSSFPVFPFNAFNAGGEFFGVTDFEIAILTASKLRAAFSHNSNNRKHSSSCSLFPHCHCEVTQVYRKVQRLIVPTRG